MYRFVRIFKNTWLFLLFGLVYGCKEKQPEVAIITEPTDSLEVVDELLDEEEEIVPEWIFRQNGKITNAPAIKGIYKPGPLDTFNFPFITNQVVEAIDNQLKLLELTTPRRPQRVGDVVITPEQLRETLKIIRAWQQTKPFSIHEYLDAYQIRGKDSHGNVQFTGYFTPIVKVNKKADAQHRHPIYSRPLQWEGRMPTRKQIESEGALKGLGLELAYAQNRVDIYYMQLQGSGFVEYPNGKQEYFSYSGTNRHPYRSIERFLLNRPEMQATNVSINGIRRFVGQNPHLADSILFHNPSYTFFTPRRTQPKGAGHVPLLEELSIAVDKRYIPLGSCLLASFPVYNRKTRKLRHEYRLFFAQDVGGRIRGPGHVDVYTGVGKNARRKANYLNHYGRLWLLLPKKDDAVSLSY